MKSAGCNGNVRDDATLSHYCECDSWTSATSPMTLNSSGLLVARYPPKTRRRGVGMRRALARESWMSA